MEYSKQPSQFSKFEHDGWQAISRGYEQHFAQLTSQSVHAALQAAEVTKNSRVLDVCCGPGMIAGAAVKLGAQAVGVDFSAEAIKIAKSSVAEAHFYENDAQSLQFPDNSFDAVICCFGLIHIPDPERALREMKRVIKPGGRVAINVWQKPNGHNGFGLLFGSLHAHAKVDNSLPHGPDFFQFSDHKMMCETLMAIGFKQPNTIEVEQFWELSEASQLIKHFTEGSVRAGGMFLSQNEEVKAAISKEIAAGMEAYKTKEGSYSVPMPAMIGSAVK